MTVGTVETESSTTLEIGVETFEVGVKNVERKRLVDSKKVLLPPLHIKLGLMKLFLKTLSKEGETLKCFYGEFLGLSEAKLKKGIFVGTDIRKLMRDPNFLEKMETKEKAAWTFFKLVVTGFLGNTKDPNYKTIVTDMRDNFKKLGCNMSIKAHFLHLHLDYLPTNLDDVCEEQGERFHQDIKEMERRNQGRWNVNIADYSWMLKRDDPERVHSQKSNKRCFDRKQKGYYKDL